MDLSIFSLSAPVHIILYNDNAGKKRCGPPHGVKHDCENHHCCVTKSIFLHPKNDTTPVEI